MKCKCYLNNEYEIVGLCDIQQFNEKISEFQDKSWAQISISDILILSEDKPNIKSITKTFICVKITSTKLITTPKSNSKNIEGMSLTGKLLLVSGEIIQRALYMPNNNSNRIHSFKIKTPFTTYIVVDEDVDISVEKYCVFSCIEYASLRVVNDKSLSQNITLFLFAHRVKATPPQPSIYPNEIILRNLTDEELSTIKFNLSTNLLEVTSTDKVLLGTDYNFRLRRASTGEHFDGHITERNDATLFKNVLNDQTFSIGDVIDIRASVGRVEITNYPNIGNNYRSVDAFERFRITDNGLVRIPIRPAINTEIKFINSDSSDPLVSIKFDSTTNVLRVKDISRGAFNDSIPTKFELFGLDGTTLKASAELEPNTNDMSEVVNTLNGVSYKTGYIIKISYGNKPTKLEIENFNPNRRTYEKGFDNNQAFIIEDRGLQEYLLNYRLELLNDSGDKIVLVYFSKFDNKTKVISSGEVAPSKRTSDTFPDYFKLIFYRDNQTPLTATVPYAQNASSFKQFLGEQPYSIGGTLSIIKDSGFSTRIWDFTVNNGDRIQAKVSRYKITENWLDAISTNYPNDIVFKNDNGSEMAIVRFTLSTGKLFVTRTNNVIQSATRRPVLQFRLYSSDGTTLKANGVISENAQAVSFVSDLNNKDFVFGDIIRVGYGNFPTRAEITNYPTDGEDYTPLFLTTESFVLTQLGLLPYMLQNSIQVFNNSDLALVEVSFDIISKQLKVVSTGNVSPSAFAGNEYFRVKLKKSNPTEEFTGTIGKNQNGTAFKNSLDGKTYNVGDKIEIFSVDPIRVRVTNFPNINEIHNPTQNTEEFTITNTKLELTTP